MNGVVEAANGAVASNLPNAVWAVRDRSWTARGNRATLVGMPVSGWLAPATCDRTQPRFAPNVSRPRTGLMSWLPSPVTNDRTMLTRSASFASLGNVAPNVTPGTQV